MHAIACENFGDDPLKTSRCLDTLKDVPPGQGSGGLASARPGWLAGHSKSTPTLPSPGPAAETGRHRSVTDALIPSDSWFE